MMERLLKRGQTIADVRAERLVDARLTKPLPPGIRAERIGTGTGIAFSGRGLKRRYVTDAALRALIQ